MVAIPLPKSADTMDSPIIEFEAPRTPSPSPPPIQRLRDSVMVAEAQSRAPMKMDRNLWIGNG